MMQGGGAPEKSLKGKDVVFLHTGGIFGWYIGLKPFTPCPHIPIHFPAKCRRKMIVFSRFTDDRLRQLVKVLPDGDVSLFVEGASGGE
jgi:hypothetical protein